MSLVVLRAAIEVKRRYSESPALDMSDRCEFQRQRKPGHEWLDWACWFLKPLDKLTPYQRRCLMAYAFMPEEWLWSERRIKTAEFSFCLISKEISEELWAQGRRIAALL